MLNLESFRSAVKRIWKIMSSEATECSLKLDVSRVANF